MRRLTVVALAALCLMGTSALALADEALNSEMEHMKGKMKVERDAMKSEMRNDKTEMVDCPTLRRPFLLGRESFPQAHLIIAPITRLVPS